MAHISEPVYLLIGELAQQANTTKDTIRHYDEIGLLKSRKRQAGSRFYTEFHPQCIERIESIKVAQAVGYTLKELAETIDNYYEGKVNLQDQINEIEEKLQQALKQRQRLNLIIETLHDRIADLDMLMQNDISAFPCFLETEKQKRISFLERLEAYD